MVPVQKQILPHFKDHFLLLRCDLCDVFLSLTIISSLHLMSVAIIYALCGKSEKEKPVKTVIILLSSILFFIFCCLPSGCLKEKQYTS